VKHRIIVRPAAEQDLDEQARHMAAHSNLETALRFYDAADQTFELLAAHPLIGRQADLPGLRGARMFRIRGFEKYLVFYRPVKSGIEVIRVIHGARDIERLLGA
jgi:toxin ParE1/3/4